MTSNKIFFIEWVNKDGQREPVKVVRPSLYRFQIDNDITDETRNYLNDVYPGWYIADTLIVKKRYAKQILT